MRYAIFDNMGDDSQTQVVGADTPHAALQHYTPASGATEFTVIPEDRLQELHRDYGCPVPDDAPRQAIFALVDHQYGVEDLNC